MSEMYFLPFRPAFDSAGVSVPGAQHYFTLAGTNTPSAPFTDATLGTHLANPIVANGIGYLTPVYLDSAISYRVRIYDADAEVGVDTPLEEYDPYVPALAYSDVLAALAASGGAALIGRTGGSTVQSYINEHPAKFTYGTAVGTTDGSGLLHITFPVGFFSTPPVVIAHNGDISAGSNEFFGPVNSSVTTSGFDVKVVSTAAAAVTAQPRRVNWLALGT